MRGVEHRVPAGGLPNADAVMERGFVLPLNHALSDEHIELVIDTVDQFLGGRGTGTTGATNGGTP
jgi:CDP-6-deoxy-D-xylo-4-hexulose-3-dehydrase